MIESLVKCSNISERKIYVFCDTSNILKMEMFKRFKKLMIILLLEKEELEFTKKVKYGTENKYYNAVL